MAITTFYGQNKYVLEQPLFMAPTPSYGHCHYKSCEALPDPFPQPGPASADLHPPYTGGIFIFNLSVLL